MHSEKVQSLTPVLTLLLHVSVYGLHFRLVDVLVKSCFFFLNRGSFVERSVFSVSVSSLETSSVSSASASSLASSVVLEISSSFSLVMMMVSSLLIVYLFEVIFFVSLVLSILLLLPCLLGLVDLDVPFELLLVFFQALVSLLVLLHLLTHHLLQTSEVVLLRPSGLLLLSHLLKHLVGLEVVSALLHRPDFSLLSVTSALGLRTLLANRSPLGCLCLLFLLVCSL